MAANSNLAGLNSATMGAKMPEIALPDGTVVQTGTVGALLINIKSYNKAYAEDDETTMERLKEAMKAPLPLLDRIGLFEVLFTAQEIVEGAGDNEGRRVFGEMFLDYKKAQK
ncbi:hypothetical protein M406DRAFT_68062 [Cryphonectria parasitica EP155]|uniref:DUF7709 domain-containing protein n=1 Tax=Cryphonectria parasitica (strain ATCC 38755 / EP155) TaxID=660469 RepID=A0A9P4Y283_CRYP1|nr:uncharacterized protein M406DRAFT_68062 [Cryphonectria parasitica EP155]KAF3765637.1 hypothetical protein M406DRAFT_68062 [Cryphonectria parasitica EP155]